MTELRLTFDLSREQLVEVLATMTACTQLHAVRPVDPLPVDELLPDLESHLLRYGTRGRPTFPRREHYAWARRVAAGVEKELAERGALIATAV